MSVTLTLQWKCDRRCPAYTETYSLVGCSCRRGPKLFRLEMGRQNLHPRGWCALSWLLASPEALLYVWWKQGNRSASRRGARGRMGSLQLLIFGPDNLRNRRCLELSGWCCSRYTWTNSILEPRWLVNRWLRSVLLSPMMSLVYYIRPQFYSNSLMHPCSSRVFFAKRPSS